MPLSLLYWILMLFWVLAGFWWGAGIPPADRWRMGGFSILLFLLFLVIGLSLFGAPIKGG